MTLPAERFNLTPIHSTSDSGMFDLDEQEVQSPIVETVDVPIDYSGEDAQKIIRRADFEDCPRERPSHCGRHRG